VTGASVDGVAGVEDSAASVAGVEAVGDVAASSSLEQAARAREAVMMRVISGRRTPAS
jgi:hypothetical protein